MIELDNQMQIKNEASNQELLANALEVAIDLLEEMQKILEAGKPKTIKVRFGDRIIAELPVALTTVGALAAGLAAVVITKLAVDVEHDD
jgi:hypothetical protein